LKREGLHGYSVPSVEVSTTVLLRKLIKNQTDLGHGQKPPCKRDREQKNKREASIAKKEEAEQEEEERKKRHAVQP
jgi:hypothetical protein